MSQPGLPGGLVEPNAGQLARKLADLERRINQLEGGRSLESSTIGKGGLKVVGGSIQILEGGTLLVTGDTRIEGTLSLPAGIIDDEELTNPLSPGIGHAQNDNFSLTTTATQKARIDVSVPHGFGRALIFASMDATARNKNTVQDFLDGYVDINGANSGWDSTADSQPNYSAHVANSASALLDPAGPSFYVRAMVRSGLASWSADSFNTVNVDFVALFLR